MKEISYKLKISKKSKRLKLAVYHDGTVLVTVPRGVTKEIVKSFVLSKYKWITKKVEFFKKYPARALPKNNKKAFEENKEVAYKIAIERLEHFNKFYKLKWNNITIKNTKTRWGSCSRKGNLNFNYKIALLSPKLRDYIIVHELCHLGEFNHSQKFWTLVSKTIPNYLELKKELKINIF